MFAGFILQLMKFQLEMCNYNKRRARMSYLLWAEPSLVEQEDSREQLPRLCHH